MMSVYDDYNDCDGCDNDYDYKYNLFLDLGCFGFYYFIIWNCFVVLKQSNFVLIDHVFNNLEGKS